MEGFQELIGISRDVARKGVGDQEGGKRLNERVPMERGVIQRRKLLERRNERKERMIRL